MEMQLELEYIDGTETKETETTKKEGPSLKKMPSRKI